MTYLPSLPRTCLVTPEPSGTGFPEFIAHLEQALNSGIRLVQLRAKTLPAPAYAELAQRAMASCRRFDARLLLNAPVNVVLALKADGVHLTSAHLMACGERPLPSTLLVSVACHNRMQILQANRINADLLTLSPAQATASHPAAEHLGWPRFSELAALTGIPVYALGGMSAATIAEARQAGAYGIAAIRSLWEGYDRDDADGLNL